MACDVVAGDECAAQGHGIAILAGGGSRRFGGQPKAVLTVGGRPLLQRVVEASAPLDLPCWVIRAHNPASDLAELIDQMGLPQLVDEHPDSGPLGALATVFSRTDCQRVLLLACDLPFLNRDFLRWLTRLAPESAAVIPGQSNTGKDRLHPLCAVYDRACEPELSACVRAGRFKVHDFVTSLQSLYIVRPVTWQAYDTGGLLSNVNTPEDLEEARRLASGRG